MSEKNLMDQIFHFIMETFVVRGFAPHYTEIAAKLGVQPEQGKILLHELMDTGIMPMWLAPDTDVIASFAPFNNLPSQYLVTIEGQQKWFAQWGFEALAVCWVFPGKEIHIEAPCLDCGDQLTLILKDGTIEYQSHKEMCGYVDIPISKWAENWTYSWSRMNLFQSEEHAMSWAGFKKGTEEGLLPTSDILAMLSTPRHNAKLSGHYVSSCPDYVDEFLETVRRINKNDPYWEPVK